MDTTPIDPGRIEVLQVLDEEGVLVGDRDHGLDDDTLLAILRDMILTRAFDSRMLTMQRQGEMGTFAPNLGQEATQIGPVVPLRDTDWFSPSYRSFGAQLHRGWTMEQLFLLWAGYHEGFSPPEGVNDLPFSIVVGSHLLPAVGVAMGMRIRNEPHVMLINFGDGATSQGAVSEALNFAGVWRAPVVFVCENNGWAISTPTSKQYASDTLAVRGLGFGMPSIRVDGNDILAMIMATRDAIQRARAGEGPTFIEAVTWRMSLHTTADDPLVYRDAATGEPWEHRCPIRRLKRLLERRGLLDDAAIERITGACEQAVLAARERFREVAIARPREIFDSTWASMPPELIEQQRAYLRRLDRKGVK